MATTTTGKNQCVTCGKEKVTYKCEGCSQTFCFNHLADHRQILIRQLDDLENERNLFRQTLSEQSNDPQTYSLLQRINHWEKDSINKIQKSAEEARQLVLKCAADNRNEIEMKLRKLTEELKQIRQEDDFNEMHLNQFQRKFKELEEQFRKPTNISLREENPTGFINKISVLITSTFGKFFANISLSIKTLSSILEELFLPNINTSTTWIQNGITVAGGQGGGHRLNQLHYPLGIYIDDDQTIYVADQYNHRIVKWRNGATSGQVVAGGNGQGCLSNQLNCPRNMIVNKKNGFLIISDQDNHRVVRWSLRNGTDGETIILNINCEGLAMDNYGYIYVSDIKKHEVRRWKIGNADGTLVAGGNGPGSRLDQLNQTYHIFIDEDHSVYVSDHGNHRVMK
jgi:hypothetical protein